MAAFAKSWRRGVKKSRGNASINAPTRRQGDSGSGVGLNAAAAWVRHAREKLCPKRRLPPLSLRLAPSAGEPLPNTVSETETNDQNDCSFQH